MKKQSEQSGRVIEYYRKTAEDYDKEYDTPYWKDLYDKITWHFIQPYLPVDGLVLDAGGGTGKWAIPIAQRGLRVVIYEISREMLNVALRKVKELSLESLIQTKEGDICHVDFPDNHFNFVLAEGDPISYCDDPDMAVAEIYRVLKPGCLVSAGVDSLFRIVRLVCLSHDLETALKILSEKRLYMEEAGFHCWLFTPEDLRELFVRHGFEVIKIIGKPVVFSKEAEPLLLDVEKAKKLLEIELMLCEQESIAGYGGHLHIVARKPREPHRPI